MPLRTVKPISPQLICTGSFSLFSNIFWTNVPISSSASGRCASRSVPLGKMIAIRPFDVASESRTYRRGLILIRAFTVPVVPDSSTRSPRGAAHRRRRQPDVVADALGRRAFEAHVRRHVAAREREGQRRERQPAALQVERQLDVGYRQALRARTSRARPFHIGIEILDRFDPQSRSGRMRCGAAPVAAAAATAPFVATMSGL